MLAALSRKHIAKPGRLGSGPALGPLNPQEVTDMRDVPVWTGPFDPDNLPAALLAGIRPYVVRNASVEGDLSAYRRYLPDREFFKDTRNPFPCVDEALDKLEKNPREVGAGLPCNVPATPNGNRVDPGAPSPGGVSR